MRTKKPPRIEMAILSRMREEGGMTVREVMDALPDGKQPAYASAMHRLLEEGDAWQEIG